MSNSHDEIKKLLKASQLMLKKNLVNEENEIKKQYGIINEQISDGKQVYEKPNVPKDVEDKIESDIEEDKPKKDKHQAYRISGGIMVIYGKEKSDLELTTDEKLAFQETMDEFTNEVSDLVDFGELSLYPNNVEWNGNIIDYNINYIFSIGEESGVYVEGTMLKLDDDFLEVLNKLKVYYEKFKSKWAKILASRKKTFKDEN